MTATRTRTRAEPAVPAGTPAPTPARLARSLPVLGVAALMAAVGAWGLRRSDAMGNDEVVTRWTTTLPWHRLAHLLGNVDAVHGLYYAGAHIWAAVAGDSPVALRLPSVVAMAAAAGLTVAIGRRLSGSTVAGVVAGTVLALTPSISYYAQTARSYAFVFLGVAATTWVLLRALAAQQAVERPAMRRWVAYAALVAVNGWLNEMSLLLLAAHAVTVLLARLGRRVVVCWLASAATGAVLVLPLVAISSGQGGVLSFLRAPGADDLRILWHDYFGATVLGAGLLTALAATALLPGPRWWRGGVTVPSVALPLLVVPAALLLAESVLLHPLYIDRYVLWGEIGAALLVGAGVRRLTERLAPLRRWAVAVPVTVVAVALAAQLGAQQRVRTPASRQFDFGAPAALIGHDAQPGDGVLFFDAFYRKARLGYPADFRRVDDLAQAVPPARAGNFRGVDKPLPQVRALMLEHARIWTIGRAPSLTSGAPGLRAESAALRQHYVRVSEHRFGRITVVLWQRR